MIERPTPDDIRAHREKTGFGLQTCKAALLKEWRLARLSEIHILAQSPFASDRAEALRELIAFQIQVEQDANG